MAMHDAGKIIPGVVLFLVLVTFPIWYTAARGQSGYRPELEYPKGEEKCVESTEYMRSWHMDLLNEWRDAVVRHGERTYTAADLKTYNMSLQNTCMKCHTNKAAFCDRCHGYVGVSPGCWDCHVEPRGE